MNLRKAVPGDASAIAKAHVDSWRSAYPDLVPDDRLAKLSYVRGAERFRESILADLEDIYVARESGNVVGFLAFGNCRDSDVHHETTGEIYGMYILPEYWRKGIGRSMCREAVRILKSQACLQANLWVFEGNERARRFYEASAHPFLIIVALSVSNSEMRIFCQDQGNQGVARRRTPVRRTRNPAD